jgi:predicted nucleic acid-binding protein
MVLFDATTLSLLLHPGAKPPKDAKGNPVERCSERIEHLVRTLDESKTKIIIPTPALSELLVIAGAAGPKYLSEINGRSCFKVSDFDQRAAVEAAAQTRDAIRAGFKRQGSEAPWAKIKFDRQIVAIAKVENVKTIYSDDEDVERYAKAIGIEVKRAESLPLPPPKQLMLGDQNAEGEEY